jgi:pilus assembly protein CpaE
MTSSLRTVIVDSDADSAAALKRILATSPSVVVVGEFATARQAAQEAPARRPDLVIVEVDETGPASPAEQPAWVIGSLMRALPGAVIFATGQSTSADFVIEVIRAGALEFIRRPVEREDLISALEKVVRLRRGVPAAARQPGHITSVFSMKGGLGVTTMATNLAVCLAERAQGSTILVDLDTSRSDVTTFLNLRPSYSILDALENLERLDESFLRGLVTKHSTGLAILPGLSRMERSHLAAEQVQAGLDVIRAYFDHVVLDLKHDMDSATIAALEASDTILFLTGLDVSALRSGTAAIAAFRHLGLSLQKVKVVVMREGTGNDVTTKHAREALGLPIHWRTPSDYPTVVASINRGTPVVTASPRSKVARNLRELAEQLGRGRRPAAESASSRVASLARRLMSPTKGTSGGR